MDILCVLTNFDGTQLCLERVNLVLKFIEHSCTKRETSLRMQMVDHISITYSIQPLPEVF